MNNRWVEHAKLVARQHKIPYGTALKVALKSYSTRYSTGNQSYGSSTVRNLLCGKTPKTVAAQHGTKEEFCRIGDGNVRWSMGKTGIVIEGPESAVLVAGIYTQPDGALIRKGAKGNKLVFPAVYSSKPEDIQRGAVPLAQLQLKLKQPYEGKEYLALLYQLTPSTYKQVGCEYMGEELVIPWDD